MIRKIQFLTIILTISFFISCGINKAKNVEAQFTHDPLIENRDTTISPGENYKSFSWTISGKDAATFITEAKRYVKTEETYYKGLISQTWLTNIKPDESLKLWFTILYKKNN